MKSDPEIARLHADCVARHKARRDELLAQPAYQAMRAQLQKASPLPPQEEDMLLRLGLM